MRTRDLKLKRCYQIDFRRKNFPVDCHYTGPAILTEINVKGYPKGTLEFTLPDGQRGFFGPEDVKFEVKVEKPIREYIVRVFIDRVEIKDLHGS